MNKEGIRKALEQDARTVKERILMAAKHENACNVAERLKIFINEHDWTQAAVAAKLGVSTAVINQLLQNKYKGNLDELCNKVINFLNSMDRRKRKVKNTAFVETAVAMQIHTLITQTDGFSNDDGDGKIGLIIGDSGHGKTRCLKEYHEANHNSVYVELDENMNDTRMFNEMAAKLGIIGIGSLDAITRRLIDFLKNRHIIIILDEASHLKVRSLNRLRQVIVVKCHCPLILAGNKALVKTIEQPTIRHGAESLDQFTSRIMYKLDLDDEASDKKGGGTFTNEDIRKLYDYGNVRLTTDGVKALRKIAKTSGTGRLHVCDVLIMSLHLDHRILKAGQIDFDDIIGAIRDLKLPVKDRLPVRVFEDEEEPKEQKQAAKIA